MIAADPSTLLIPAGGAAIAVGLASLLLSFHRRYSHRYLHIWGRANLLLGLFWLALILTIASTGRWSPWNPLRLTGPLLAVSLALGHAALIAWGGWELASRRPLRHRDARLWGTILGGTALAFSLAMLALPDTAAFQGGAAAGLMTASGGAAQLWGGVRIRRLRAARGGLGMGAFSWALMGGGALALVLSLGIMGAVARGLLPLALVAVAGTLPPLLAAVSMIVFVLEDEREAAVEAASQVEHIAYHDAMTGLPNRALFLDRLIVALAQASRHQTKLAVLFLDLDRFKQVNDSLGHSMGDVLLRSAAERIRRTVRNEDTIARFGGDEFAVLLHGLERIEDAGKVGRKILDALASPFNLGEREIFTTSSLGIAIYPNDGMDAEALLKNADTAMYRAKNQGGDHYQFYNASMNSRSLELLEMESGLRKAIRDNELTLFYQPLIDLQSGGIYGLEALLRWNHPTRGTIMPESFIPVAEVSGLIVPIGSWVMREACRQAKFWQRQKGTDLVVSVNLSARQFQQADLVDQVRLALEESRLQPRLLELEITESSAMQDVARTIRVLRELKTLGVRIAIDDFGTGYSSLSYLKEFPVDTLKLDQSFVRDLIAPQDAKIVSGVIAMAHSMSLQVMAEGVETLNQLDFLRSHECDKLQGFLFSRPLPPESFDRYMTHHRAWRGLA